METSRSSLTIGKIAKAAVWVILALIALKIIAEIFSLLSSGWFIIAAIAVWWFFIRKKN